MEKDMFWALTPEKLNDPCEGLVTSDILINQIDAVVRLFAENDKNVDVSVKELKNALRNVLEKKDTSGVYSLSKTSTDELLWAHYANSHHGFCIEYELETLVYFGRNEFFNFDVKYSDHPPLLTIEDMLKINEKIGFIQKLIGIKSKRWAYEKELRVVTSEAGAQSYDYRAVKAIHFGIRMPNDKKQEIMRKLKGRNIKYYQTELQENSYKFFSKSIEDDYPTNERYLYSIAPIAEHAVDPSTLNEQWSEYAPYLQKVAEIIRREPYCNEVLMVDVSYEKSKPGKPVFFGQFKRSTFRYENIYFTPKEVDEKYTKISDLEAELINV
ncbi:MAG TPA: DUF2971 domain-containing protein [Gammaproteobacteria bacterium]